MTILSEVFKLYFVDKLNEIIKTSKEEDVVRINPLRLFYQRNTHLSAKKREEIESLLRYLDSETAQSDLNYVNKLNQQIQKHYYRLQAICKTFDHGTGKTEKAINGLEKALTDTYQIFIRWGLQDKQYNNGTHNDPYCCLLFHAAKSVVQFQIEKNLGTPLYSAHDALLTERLIACANAISVIDTRLESAQYYLARGNTVLCHIESIQNRTHGLLSILDPLHAHLNQAYKEINESYYMKEGRFKNEVTCITFNT